MPKYMGMLLSLVNQGLLVESDFFPAAKKKAAYGDYKRLRKENQELQTVKSNVDALLRIEQVQEYQREKENNQEQGR